MKNEKFKMKNCGAELLFRDLKTLSLAVLLFPSFQKALNGGAD
jgi:hypothetical protein